MLLISFWKSSEVMLEDFENAIQHHNSYVVLGYTYSKPGDIERTARTM